MNLSVAILSSVLLRINRKKFRNKPMSSWYFIMKTAASNLQKTQKKLELLSWLCPFKIAKENLPVRQFMLTSRQSAKLFSSRRNRDSPNPSPAGECAPPPKKNIVLLWSLLIFFSSGSERWCCYITVDPGTQTHQNQNNLSLYSKTIIIQNMTRNIPLSATHRKTEKERQTDDGRGGDGTWEGQGSK